MTFFLKKPPTEALPARGAGQALPSYWDGLGAHFTSRAIDTSSNFRVSRTRADAERTLIEQALPAFGGDAALAAHFGADPAKGLGFDVTEDPRLRQRVLEALRRDAEARPEAYEGIDLSEEGVETATNAVLDRERQDAQDMAALAEPGWTAPFIGGTLADVADVRTAPLLALGFVGAAPRTFLSIAGREAALNVAAEAATLPSQFDMAERLQIEDPAVLATLRDAALVGAAFGAGGEAIVRGISYFRGTRGRAESRIHPADEQAGVDVAETAFLNGGNPAEEARAVVREALAETRAEAVEARPPLIVREEPAPVESETAPVIGEDAPQSSNDPFDPDPEAVSARNGALDQLYADFPQLRGKRNLTRWMTGRGGIAWFNTAPDGTRTKTWAAQELENRGVTQKQALSMVRKDGHQDLDNLDPDDEDMAALFGRDDTGNYLNREAIVNALAREITSGKSEPTTASMRARLDEVESLARAANSPRRTPTQDFTEKVQAPGGLFVRLDDYGFDDDAGFKRIGEDLDAYVASRYPGLKLQPRERAELHGTLASEGGEADYLIERVLEREFEFGTAPKEEIYDDIPGFDDIPASPLAGAPRQDGEGAGGAGAPAGAVRGAAEGEGGLALQSERTAAGDQTLVPGVAPVSLRERLEAKQNAPLARAVRAADEGLFDLGARAQVDWLDDPSGPKAKPIRDQRTADLRRQAEANDEDVLLADGSTVKLSAALDNFDDGEDLLAALDACGIGRRPDA